MLVLARQLPLALDAPRQLDVLDHEGDALGVHGAQEAVLKEPDHVRLRRLPVVVERMR